MNAEIVVDAFGCHATLNGRPVATTPTVGDAHAAIATAMLDRYGLIPSGLYRAVGNGLGAVPTYPQTPIRR